MGSNKKLFNVLYKISALFAFSGYGVRDGGVIYSS